MVYASYLLTRSCETSWEDVPWRVLAIKMAKKTFNSLTFLYCPGCLEVIFRGHDHIESEGWKLLLAHLSKSTPLLQSSGIHAGQVCKLWQRNSGKAPGMNETLKLPMLVRHGGTHL